MPKFTQVHEREWIHEDVVGHAVDRCKLWYDGHGISFSLVKWPANYELSRHRHETWVAVFIVEGSALWRSGDQERKVEAGDFYFVTPGEDHVETSIEETTTLVIKAEPNIQYPIDEDGQRRVVEA
ncbi:cupin domain-containing protein [Streptomyces sp. ME19-01-6]|uniref:cupin domain-containing protein n=1 Tax=Streptomyces sp. ME19-01-6 TaxID=3028686 RepID=UPI0029AD8794|nr:cupin domain-containing protein [Streptomyces sp. ME19-01-6]MDX3233923.1 cupin domain-containing protein [Streptomyces sp. ME19-01-6]